MKYADLMGKDTGVDLMDCIAEATKNSLDVGHARSAMNILNKNGGAPTRITAAMHDYYRQKRGVQGGGSVPLQLEPTLPKKKMMSVASYFFCNRRIRIRE